jgi:hypothetical protein
MPVTELSANHVEIGRSFLANPENLGPVREKLRRRAQALRRTTVEVPLGIIHAIFEIVRPLNLQLWLSAFLQHQADALV